MENITGPLGFTIPVQSLANSPEVTLTPAGVALWCKNLVVTDFGHTTKKLFHALSDSNKVNLSPKDRFEILESFSHPLHFIHYSLNKHFIHQTKKLTKHQLIIADLSQTLQSEMANGYKLVLEQFNVETDPAIFPVALHRVIFHTTQVIRQHYLLYSVIPPKVWKELHLAYKITEEKQLQNQHNLGHQYKKTLLLALANPYDWNQYEQFALYRAVDTWANLITLQKQIPNEAQGIYLVDLNEDAPPIVITDKTKQLTPTAKILDLNPILARIQTLLTTIGPNELKARIAHNHEAEYSLTIPILKGLEKEWGTPAKRLQERENVSEKLQVCAGFISTHYYVNGEREFKQTILQNEEASTAVALPTLTVHEEGDEKDPTKNITTEEETESPERYPLYNCTLVNENSNGYGILWPDNAYPPIQAGEIVGIKRTTEGIPTWQIGKIRWLQHRTETEFRMGIEIVAKSAKAGTVQLVEEGKTSGISLRCLFLESSVLVPILPFKTGHRIAFITDDNPTPAEFELDELIDSTGSYKEFSFKAKHSLAEKEALMLQKAAEEAAAQKTEETPKNPEEGEGFDSVWSHL